MDTAAAAEMWDGKQNRCKDIIYCDFWTEFAIGEDV